MAAPGELHDAVSGVPAKRFRVCGSSYKDLDAFGIGIALYFRQLLSIGALLLLCSLVSLFALAQNDKAADPKPEDALRGSAVGVSNVDLSMAKQGVSDIIVCIILIGTSLYGSRQEGNKLSPPFVQTQNPLFNASTNN